MTNKFMITTRHMHGIGTGHTNKAVCTVDTDILTLLVGFNIIQHDIHKIYKYMFWGN